MASSICLTRRCVLSLILVYSEVLVRVIKEALELGLDVELVWADFTRITPRTRRVTGDAAEFEAAGFVR